MAVDNHYKRVQAGADRRPRSSWRSPTSCCSGPTGCGKTFLAQTLARMLNVPFAIADATALTEAGYVGEDVENILLKLIQAADYDVKRAETGIIYIDEIDKIARKSENPSSPATCRARACSRPCSRSSRARRPRCRPRAAASTPTRSSSRSTRPTSCSSAGGPSPGWTRSSRAGSAARASASGPRSAAPRRTTRAAGHVLPEDLMKFGLIPEFVGRLPWSSAVSSLDREALIRILVEPKNALVKQYQRVFELDGVELEFTEDALEAVAEQALLRGTGGAAAGHPRRGAARSHVRPAQPQPISAGASSTAPWSSTGSPPRWSP